MDFGTFEILTGVVALTLGIYYFLVSNLQYWDKLGVEGPKPVPIFGNFKDVFMNKKHVAQLINEFYKEFKSEPLIGVYELNQPKLIVKDLDLLKDVMIRDFNVFADRGPRTHEKVEPFSLHLVNLELKRWKPLRAKLTPIFTSGKLKDMFYLISDCADHFQKYALSVAKKSDSVDCYVLASKFTIETIGVCAFGLDMNAIADKESEFRTFGRNLFEPSLKNRTRKLLRTHLPTLYDIIGGLLQPNANKFFEKSVKQNIDYRKENNVRKNDFIDLLIDLKNNSNKTQDFELTDRLLISQAYVFFGAGFQTAAITISHTLYELALNQHIQNKLREEINDESAKCGGKLTYDSIKNMKYLDQIVKETLRKHPAVPFVIRKSLSSYTFKGTNVTIPEGTRIIIPIGAIHNDPDFHHNPEEYDPERFSEANGRSRGPMTYIPFGDGPRSCIAIRFADYQVKLGIIAIIQKLKAETCDKTCNEYRMAPKTRSPLPVNGIHLKLTEV